jgi:ribosomal protein S24E
MEAKLTSVSENPLLDRFEAEAVLEHDGEATPSEEDVVARIAAENNLDEDEIQVEGIYTGFGSNTSRVELKITQEFEYDEELEEETIQEEEEDTGVEEVEETEEAEEEPEEAEDETGEAAAEADYDDIVSGTISDAKDTLEDLEDPDWEAALEAEKDGKDRKTFKEWLENRQ